MTICRRALEASTIHTECVFRMKTSITTAKDSIAVPLQKPRLTIEQPLPIPTADPGVRSIRLHNVGAGFVFQVFGKDTVSQAAYHPTILDGKEHLYAAIQVAGHHVGASGIDTLVAAIVKVKNSAVF
jgi:hypothetical protein